MELGDASRVRHLAVLPNVWPPGRAKKWTVS